jgi:undecaprenyl-diphosphatase
MFLSINNIANKFSWLDNLAILSAEYLPYIFIGVLLYLWFVEKQDNKENSLYAGYSVLLALAINWIIGNFYFHPRPFMDGIGTALINHDPDASFPSDHTTFLISIALTLTFIKETRKLGLYLCIFAAIGGLARVFCGAHYPFDIIGSLLTSTAASLIVTYLKNKLTVINQFIITLYYQVMNATINKALPFHTRFSPKNKYVVSKKLQP